MLEQQRFNVTRGVELSNVVLKVAGDKSSKAFAKERKHNEICLSLVPGALSGVWCQIREKIRHFYKKFCCKFSNFKLTPTLFLERNNIDIALT